MSKIKIGSLVRLKSGGPMMKVRSFEGAMGKAAAGQRKVNCEWYDETELLRGTFRVLSLTKENDRALMLECYQPVTREVG